MCTIYNPLLVSNNFLEKSKKENINISPMKLQKLLYFSYREYSKNTKSPMFAERFETWKYGPVLSSVYNEFKHYKDKPIDKYYSDNNGKSRKIDEDSDYIFKMVLEGVWARYKHFTGIQLSELTHKPGTAWYKARVDNNCFLLDENIYLESQGDYNGVCEKREISN